MAKIQIQNHCHSGKMKLTKKWRFLLVFVGIVIAAGLIFNWWALTFVTADDIYFLYRRDDDSDVAIAFTIALRKNHPSAYKMSAPDLTPRLNEWMATHQEPECVRRVNDILSGGVNGISVYYRCETQTQESYRLVVKNIVVNDMKVVDWGEIEEDK